MQPENEIVYVDRIELQLQQAFHRSEDVEHFYYYRFRIDFEKTKTENLITWNASGKRKRMFL